MEQMKPIVQQPSQLDYETPKIVNQEAKNRQVLQTVVQMKERIKRTTDLEVQSFCRKCILPIIKKIRRQFHALGYINREYSCIFFKQLTKTIESILKGKMENTLDLSERKSISLQKEQLLILYKVLTGKDYKGEIDLDNYN